MPDTRTSARSRVDSINRALASSTSVARAVAAASDRPCSVWRSTSAAAVPPPPSRRTTTRRAARGPGPTARGRPAGSSPPPRPGPCRPGRRSRRPPARRPRGGSSVRRPGGRSRPGAAGAVHEPHPSKVSSAPLRSPRPRSSRVAFARWKPSIGRCAAVPGPASAFSPRPAPRPAWSCRRRGCRSTPARRARRGGSAPGRGRSGGRTGQHRAHRRPRRRSAFAPRTSTSP